MQQLDMFQEEESVEPTLEELEKIHGVFPGSPGWTDEMEQKRLKMLEEIQRHTNVLLEFEDGHQERVPFYGHSYIQGLKLMRRGNVFTLKRLKELGVKLITIEANQRTYDVNHIQKLEDIKTELPKLNLDNI